MDQHLERILSSTNALGSETIPLSDAIGRCLAGSVEAAVPVPPWTNSAMDGYAVRFDDLKGASETDPVTLRVVAEVPAGSGEDPPIRSGEAARIMTGATLPSSADTVIPQELTDLGAEVVQVRSTVERGRHVRHAGEDRTVGDRIAAAGHPITPEMVAAIASAGVAGVRVSKRPRVAVISTGDELVPPGASLSRGQIPDSNSLLVSMLCDDTGCTSVTGHAGDGTGDLKAVLDRHAKSCDVVVMTGGVSVGDHDPVKELFEQGNEIRFDRVAMQPGKPQAFGKLGTDGPIVFGLPGNPVSAWVSFQMFVRPCLRKLQGYVSLTPAWVWSVATEDWNTPKGRTQIIPVTINERWSREIRPAASGGSGSHLIASLARADGYARVGAEVEQVRQGDEIQSVRLRDVEQFNRKHRSSS